MPLPDSYALAELHREVYVAIIRGWVPHGQAGQYARRAGITRQHLWFVLSLDPPTGQNYAYDRRQPSAAVAQELAAALPAPREIRESLVGHMALSRDHARQARAHTHQQLENHEVAELLDGLQVQHREATFGVAGQPAQRAYRALRQASLDLVERLSPRLYPASFSQTCLYLHDAQCVLDRADDALYFARLAQLALDGCAEPEALFTRPEADDLRLNAIRGEAVAYHNLGLERCVPSRCDRAQAARAYGDRRGFWQPLVARDRLNALANIPRSSRRSARATALDAMAVCEKTGDAFAFFLVREAWLRCLVQFEDWRGAQAALQEEYDLLPRLPHHGPLHRALLFKTGAYLAWRQGDWAGWRDQIGAFVHVARSAGLNHQLRLVRALYGSALQPIADDLGSLPDEPRSGLN